MHALMKPFKAIAHLALAGALLSANFPAIANVTSAQFAVSESGAATLNIPVQIPRGIGGMEPQLSLSYSSGSGNGLLGVGWSLQGPSAITRCPRTLPLDAVRGTVNFDANDRFCLDGQRLLKIDPANPNAAFNPTSQASGYGAPGSQYRTERDSFSRITAVGSYLGQANVPAAFKVETKSGLVLEFGNLQGTTTTAHIHSQVLTRFSSLAAGRVETINRWMLRRISDRNGSSVEFVYCRGDVTPLANIGDAPSVLVATSACTAPTAWSGSAPLHSTAPTTWSGSQPLHYIRYTNRNDVLNGTLGVVFRYGKRHDVAETFHAGASFAQTTRMVAIQTFMNFNGPDAPGSLVRSYDITYEPIENGTTGVRATTASIIKAVQERGADGATMPAVTMTYASDGVFGQAVQHTATATVGTPRVDSCGGVVKFKLQALCP